MMSRRITALITVLFGAVLLNGPGAAAELKKVAINFGLTTVAATGAPLFSVPKVMGFWRDEGLDVEVQLANGVGSALQQLIAGQVVGTVGGLPPTLTLINKGAKIIVGANFYSRNVYYPVALETSRIKTVEDMKGAKIGVTSASSSNVFFIRAMLLKHGIDPDKDVTLVSVGSGPAALQALTSGRIDVLQLFEASYDQIERMGYKLRRFDNVAGFNDLNFTFGMTVGTDVLKSDPDLIVRILRGMAKGVVYAKAHPEEAVRMHWQVYPLSKPQGVSDNEALARDLPVLQSALKSMGWVAERKFGYAPMDAVATMVNTMKQYGELDQALAPEKYYDPSLVAKINDFDPAEVIARRPPK
jgi:NitT/TauT family transport system substrate-binding protein